MPLVGFAGRDWTVFGAMAAGPMLIGHTGMNYVLRHFRATTVNVAALGEPVGASVIAWLVPSIHEVPPPAALLGGILVLLGIGLSVRDRKSTRLNSSHVSTSYDVFCLKKKRKTSFIEISRGGKLPYKTGSPAISV